MPWVLRQSGDTSDPVLARPYGKQSTRGMLVYFERDGNRTKFILLLAQGGRYGCDGIDKYRYNGHTVNRLDGGGNPQWVFHPGTRSTGYTDPVQGRPTFFPNLNFCFSEQCYLEVNLPVDLSPEDPEEEPTGSEVFMRGLKVMHYDLVGGRLQETSPLYSANNAWVSLDILRECNRMPLSRFQRWAQSWEDFEARCDELIPWDKGVAAGGVVTIPRFDAHIVFPQSTSPLTAFNSVLARSPGVRWQDVNGGIRILTTLDRDSVHTLRWDPTGLLAANIAKHGLGLTPKQARSLYNFFIYIYRDLDDDEFAQKQIFVDLKELRDSVGGALVQLGPINLGVMHQSLAERIGWYIARSTSAWTDEDGKLVFPVQLDVKGQFDSYHVAKGDNVNVAHDLITVRNGAPLFCTVNKETFEATGGERLFTVQVTARDLYRDTDHSVKQGTGTSYGITTDDELPAAIVGQPYSITLQESGGTAPITWSITGGALPASFSLDPATGTISGTAVVEDLDPGLFDFTVQISDALGVTASRSYELPILGTAPPVITSLVLTEIIELTGEMNVMIGIRGTFNFATFDGGQYAQVFLKGPSDTEPADSEYRLLEEVSPDSAMHGSFELRGLTPGNYWVKVSARSLAGVGNTSGDPVVQITISAPLASIIKIFDNVPPHDVDMGLGITVGLARSSGVGAWYGAQVWRNRGYGYEVVAPAIETEATLGHTDPGHSFLPSSAGTLYFVKEGGANPVNATPTEITNGKNNYFVGRERLGVQTWTNVGGVWEGTDLVRGLGHTDIFQSSHTAQEDVIQLDENAYFIPIEFRDLNQALNYKAVTYGLTLSGTTATPFTPRGDSIRPYALSTRTGTRDTSLDWYFTGKNNTRAADQPANFVFLLRRVSDGAILRTIPIRNYKMAAMWYRVVVGNHDDVITNNNVYSLVSPYAESRVYAMQKMDAIGAAITGKITLSKADTSSRVSLALLTDDEPDLYSGYANVLVGWQSSLVDTFSVTGQENVFHNIVDSAVLVPTTDGVIYFMLALIGTEFQLYFSTSGFPVPGTSPIVIKGSFAFAEFPVRLAVAVANRSQVENVWISGLNDPQTIYGLRQQKADLINLGVDEATASLGLSTIDVEMWEVSRYAQIDKGFSTRDIF